MTYGLDMVGWLVGWLVGWSVISFCYGTSKIKNIDNRHNQEAVAS
jgi:hypothetical protein